MKNRLRQTQLGRWLWRKWWVWKLRNLELPYPYPRNEYEDAMNEITVLSEIGRPPMSGRADW